MSGKVWLVSEGSYSDYRIVAAFSTRQGAEEFVRHENSFSSWDFGKPEPYRVRRDSGARSSIRRRTAARNSD